MCIKVLFIILLLISLPSPGVVKAHKNQKKSACSQYCFIPEYHRVKRVFITDFPAVNLYFSSPKYVAEFIQSVWKATDKNKIKIHLTTTKERYKEIKKLILKNNPWLNEGKINQYLQLIFFDNPESIVIWQRDFFKFIQYDNQKFLTYINGYEVVQELKQGVAKKNYNLLKDSMPGVKSKEVGLYSNEFSGNLVGLPSSGEVTGVLGGNIDSFIEDTYMLGNRGMTDNEWENYSQNLCPLKNKAVKIDTDWLLVGHVDEIIKVIRPKNKKLCNWTILYPDTELALKMLKADSNKNFISYPSKVLTPCPSTDIKCEERLDMNKICLITRLLNKNNKFPEKNNNKAKELSLIPCDQLRNMDMEPLMHYTTFLKFNQLIQKRINTIVSQLKAKVMSLQPKCKTFDFLPVPMLYYNLELVNQDYMKVSQLPEEQRFMMAQKLAQDVNEDIFNSFKASNLLPNPINSLQLENTILTPEAYNQIFQNYFTQEMKKRGFQVLTLDTLHFGHVGRGDIHCTTNTETECD